MLKAFYGETWNKAIDVSLIPNLTKFGFKFPSGDQSIPKDQIGQSDKELTKEELSFFTKRDYYRKQMPEYIPDGPMLITPPSKEKAIRIIIPHIQIRSPLQGDRI